MTTTCRPIFLLLLSITSHLIKCTPVTPSEPNKESLQDPDPGPLHPIILIPGDGGSQIEARLNKTSTNHWWCSKVSDWYDLWLNIEQMLTLMVECWADNVRLTYNSTTHTTSNAPGVETRIPGFGNTTSSVEWIDKSMRGFSTYFSLIVSKVLPMGYIRGENIHGAPYDFRRAANEHADYFVRVKALIESTYAKNGNNKVLLVSHSMGSIMMSYFLNHQTQAWKDKYIRSLISVAGVWGGTARAVKVFAVGDNLDSWFLNEKNLLWERTNPSLAWLMPSKDFWPDDEVLVQTEEKNFTRSNLGEYFTHLGVPDMASMVDDTKDLLAGLPAPNVEVFCSHGSKVDTTEQVVYPKGSFPKYKVKRPALETNELSKTKIWPWPSDPSLIKGDGDGTVNIRSLQGCLKWKGKQKQQVHHKVFEKVNHLDMLRTEEPTQHVADIIANLNKKLKLKQQNSSSEPIISNYSKDENPENDLKTTTDAIESISNDIRLHPIIEVV